MRLTSFCFAALALASGCFESHAPTCTVECASDNECPSGLTCGPSNRCSENGASCDDTACTADALRCKPGADTTNVIEKCDAEGVWMTSETCAASCVAGATPRCGYIEPTFAALKTVCDTPAVAPQRLLSDVTVFTDDVAKCSALLPQVGGPPICVIRAGTIAVSGIVTFRGMAAVALVADGNVAIEGTLDVSATFTTDAAGGGGAARASGVGSTGASGGGGAGFRTAGANGGGPAAQPGGLGGPMVSDPTTSPILVGGFRAGTALSSTATVGGGAGGAVAIISCAGTVRVAGTIDAGGGGGSAGGDYSIDEFRSAGGGGSGGVIAIQATQIEIAITGDVYANGGAGGGGTVTSLTKGVPGEEGSQSTALCARGGLTADASSGRGGNGGCLIAPPENGSANSISSGGGGGSMGYSILYTPANITPLMGGVASPPLTLSTVNVR